MPPHKTKKAALKAVNKPVVGKPGKVVKPTGAKNGGPAKPAPAPPAPSALGTKVQYDAFEKAVQLLHKRKYREAKALFESARHGPVREIAVNAATHVRMCDRRLA